MKEIKLLISPQFGIGDSLLSTPAIKILKNKLNVDISLFTFNKPIYDIFKTNKDIDRLIYYPILKKNFFKSFYFVLSKLSFKYDVCINFYPSNRYQYNIFSFLTFAKKRVGHRYKHSNFLQMNWLKNFTIMEDEDLHCVEENVRLLKLLNINVSKEEIFPLLIYFKEEELKNAKKIIGKKNKFNNFIGIHPGTSRFKNQFKRRWPKENFLKLIKYLLDKKNKIFVFGGKDDKDVLNYLKLNIHSEDVLFINNKDIRTVGAIIKNLDLFISNDSGLMHLAAACNIPVVAIFGPTNPNWVRPWKVKHEIVRCNIECSPCFFYSPKPLSCHRKIRKFECLKKISVDMVIEKVEKLL